MAEIKWWQNALVYQIYPMSFKDSNQDGMGDLNGITDKLDYLKDFGVDCIWLSPVYESPMDDNGYDISNYYEINPMFGTKEELEKLLNEAHKRKIRVIMDLVLNHTSDEHVWFKEAVRSKESPYYSYYIWRDEPTDITSVFSGPAWTYHEEAKAYYFHLFSKKQPDLNWQNPALRQEIYQMINYWLDFGFDGFRLDVIDLIGKDIDQKRLSDGPYLEKHLLELYETCFKGRDIMTVGEMPGISIERAKEITSQEHPYLNMVFQFTHIALDEIPGKGKWTLKKLDLVELKKVFQKTQKIFEKDGWNSLFWSNHDQPRAVTRYGNEVQRVRSAQMLFTTLYGMKGTPYVYQGEELGMTGIRFEDLQDYRDIETKNMYQEALLQGKSHDEIMRSIYAKGRDNSRTPMQWNQEIHAGFSQVEPWIKVNPNYKTIHAENEIKDPNGVYQYAKKLFEIRKTYDVFTTGAFRSVLLEHEAIHAYIRFDASESVLVIGNTSDQEVYIDLALYESYEALIANDEITFSKKTIIPAYHAGIYRKK